MIVKPEIIIEKKILTNIISEKEQIQQNGIDITLKYIDKLEMEDKNLLYKEKRSHVGRYGLDFNKEGLIELNPGVYDVLFNEKISIPNGMCATIYTRSTLNRGGNYIIAGLYDAGYKGVLGAMLHVNVPIILEKGVRLAQIVFNEAQEGKEYDGIYNKKTVA